MRSIIAFWEWWGGELASLVPDALKVAYFGGRFARPAQFAPNLAAVEIRRSGVLIPEALLDATPPVISKLTRTRSVDVTLPKDLVLARLIQAPRKARGKLEPLAKLDLKRNTPIPEGAVVWRLGPEQTVDGAVTATQYVAKKADLNALRQSLSSIGLHVRSFAVEMPNGRLLTLGEANATGSNGRHWRRLNAALAIGCLSVAAFLWLQPALVARTELPDLESELDALRTATVELRRARDAEADRRSEAERIQAALHLRPRLVETIRNVTVALPDEAWLLTMSFTPEVVTLSGETLGAASELVLGLSENRSFGNPRLSGPVTRTNSNREKFEIAAQPRATP